MKGKKNLEKVIVMGLMLSSIAAPVWAADNTGRNGYIDLPDNGIWEGKMNQNGEGVSIDSNKTFDTIFVKTTGVDDKYDNWSVLGDTTTALLIDNSADVKFTGPVTIINAAKNEFDNQETIDNNNALYIKNGTVTIDSGDERVIIYALDGKENRSAAISIRNNSELNLISDNAQIIGNIDFLNQDGDTGNKANLTLSSANSFWYGNEGQAANIEQLTDLINKVADDVVKATSGTVAEGKLNKEFCLVLLNPAVSDILTSFGGGKLELELKDNAEWVYDSNGNTEVEFTNDMLIGYIPQSLMTILDTIDIKYPGTKEKFLSNLKTELGDTIDVTIQAETSKISAITLNGGVVNLQDDDIQRKYADYIIADGEDYIKHQKVTIGELNGNGGIFKVDLDWTTNNGKKVETDNSDYIYIEKVNNTTKANPTQIIDFDASKAHLDQMEIGKDKLYFANVAEGTTDFVTVNGTKQAVSSSVGNIYNYGYEVAKDGKDFYVAVTDKSAEGNANYESAKGAMYAGYALGTELDTLNKRMGEARYLEDDNGVWVRYRHAKTGWDDTFETNSNMFQLGFDNEVQEDDGTHYRGVAVDYTDADTSLMHASGDGENKRYAVSLYDTWIGEKGHYRDLVLRGGRINSDYDISGMFSNGMEDIGGDYHQWFGSISAEWGRKNAMQSGWYFEPQTQLQLARVGGASYVSDSGIAVDQDGATSLIGRVGFRLGREYEKDNGKTDNYYFKADLMHEFMGDKGIALSTATERYTDEYDGQETWFDIGLGADISIGKNSFFWADVERTLGADFDNTWQINGGFRWEF